MIVLKQVPSHPLGASLTANQVELPKFADRFAYLMAHPKPAEDLPDLCSEVRKAFGQNVAL